MKHKFLDVVLGVFIVIAIIIVIIVSPCVDIPEYYDE